MPIFTGYKRLLTAKRWVFISVSNLELLLLSFEEEGCLCLPTPSTEPRADFGVLEVRRVLIFFIQLSITHPLDFSIRIAG